jgi:hypothetical protein
MLDDSSQPRSLRGCSPKFVPPGPLLCSGRIKWGQYNFVPFVRFVNVEYKQYLNILIHIIVIFTASNANGQREDFVGYCS